MASGLGLALLLAGSLALGGCASAPKPAPASAYTPATIDVPPETARAAPAFTRAGSPATWDALVAAATNADVILIGETHGHELGLAAAAALFEDVLAKRPDAVLALEFLERDQQVAMDDYLTGITDEAGFAKAANRTRSSYPGGHRAMVEAAKAAGRPVIAANAPRRYVRIARTQGYATLRALGPEQRRLFRVPDALPTGRYRDDFARIMGAVHAPETETDPAAGDAPPELPPVPEWTDALEATFRSQVLWDWTMGQSVANALNLGRPVVLVVGRFHVDHDGGTVQAVRTLAPMASVLTVTFQDQEVPAKPQSDGPADFVFYVGPSAAE